MVIASFLIDGDDAGVIMTSVVCAGKTTCAKMPKNFSDHKRNLSVFVLVKH
jgi:hypothetical protein